MTAFDTMPFIKMHGLGNDFVVLDARQSGPMPDMVLDTNLARLIADRRLGIGCDQIMVLRDAQAGGDIFLDMRNQDGSQTGACGNGTRCVAALVSRQTGSQAVAIETISGLLHATKTGDEFEVDMGPARLGWHDIPLSQQADTAALDLAPLEEVPAICVNMGNPHAVLFVEDAEAVDVASRGAALERHHLFPEGANISFAHMIGPDKIRMRVFERGVGITMACGSGACAVAVAAHRAGHASRSSEVVLDGGSLFIRWVDDGTTEGRVFMRGPVATSYEGHLSGDLARAFKAAQMPKAR